MPIIHENKRANSSKYKNGKNKNKKYGETQEDKPWRNCKIVL